MSLTADIRSFYSEPVRMTSPGGYASAVEAVPGAIEDVCRVVQGLLLHEHWASAYKVDLDAGRRAESHLRSMAEMLDRISSHDPRPLTEARDPAKRAVGVCRHFSVLACGILRAKGVPARARCGFGAYFNSGKFEDHWVVEYWSDEEERWIMADAQIDALQKGALRPSFSLLDVPRNQFVIAGDAWQKCRAGEANPELFGIFAMRGLWFIAGNVLRDFAALNNMEMLPWDSWGAMPEPDQRISDDLLNLVDRVAGLTRDCDRHFEEVRALYESDERLRVPRKVFNALTARLEDV